MRDTIHIPHKYIFLVKYHLIVIIILHQVAKGKVVYNSLLRVIVAPHMTLQNRDFNHTPLFCWVSWYRVLAYCHFTSDMQHELSKNSDIGHGNFLNSTGGHEFDRATLLFLKIDM